MAYIYNNTRIRKLVRVFCSYGLFCLLFLNFSKFTLMKNKLFLILGIGLFLTSVVSFASDDTKITKECGYEIGDLNCDVYAADYVATSFELAVSHNFEFVVDFTNPCLPGSLEGPADVGKNFDHYGTLGSSVTIYKRSGKYPDINYWILYRKDLDFKLTNTLNSKAPECLCRHKC